MKKYLKFLAPIVVFFVAALILTSVYLLGNKKEDSLNKSASVSGTYSLTINDGIDSKEFSVQATGQSLFADMLDLQNQKLITLEYQESDYGKFITNINASIKDFMPDIKDSFWKIKINGEDAQVGVTDITPQGGDKIEFLVEKVQNN
ncbi:MAG: DUF4430 domain-containing protein [bacterium]